MVEEQLPVIKVEEFLRLHPLRAPGIAWFLGAGASAAAGIPTAHDMIWEFKRSLFCATQRVSLESCADLGSSEVRLRLQRHFDDRGGFPAQNSALEYAEYFEAAYPDEGDRQRYLDRQVMRGTPSFGHYALAALMRADRVRMVWTPNFDPMIEDVVAQMFGTTGRLTTATLDAPELALQAMNEARWPILGKVHGDFRSRRLKNVSEELRTQDATLRRALIESCRRLGLAVVGYSGRDQSIIDAFTEAIDGGSGYPGGLYWFHRGEEPPLPAVAGLLKHAASTGVKAALVSVETFDELMGDLLLLEQGLPAEVADLLASKRKRHLTPAPTVDRGLQFPVIRMNAFPVLTWPQTVRLAECEIGGAREVRDAVKAADVDLIVARRRAGVLAFGADADVRRALASNKVRRLDLHRIEIGRLRYDSVELGMLYESLARALARELPLLMTRRRRTYRLVVDSAQIGDSMLASLRAASGGLVGAVPGSGRPFAEACDVHLEFRLDRLWLLLEPAVWVGGEAGRLDSTSKEFIRKRLAARYNRHWNALLDAWRDLLVGDDGEREVRAFGCGDGVDAVFTIGGTTAYTRRAA